MEEQSQVEELQKNLQEQGSKADDVSKCLYSCTHTVFNFSTSLLVAVNTESNQTTLQRVQCSVSTDGLGPGKSCAIVKKATNIFFTTSAFLILVLASMHCKH